MAALTTPLTGDALLGAVNDSLVALHERYHHRTPASARTQLLDDELLACVLRGIYSDVEKTMIELQRHATVRETRSMFHQAIRGTFIGEVERLSGRRVTTFMSHCHTGPDLEVQLFVLAPPA